ncbi:hypothetical protein DM860_016905 [Cuscuta australis]|uniref:NAC domain-containing protein n=1 Tax=Cuscuta australis TaxID=267555 RepID=A0A328E0Y3_9ASTE|nr:hypothetical protein DM860_016905 [Cuscuta australis]
MEGKESLPPGFRFHPTDEELVTFYLGNKLRSEEEEEDGFTTRAIADVDLNKSEPWDLPRKAKMGGKEWYFFSRRDRKYPTGVRTNRATGTGYWKTTGKDKEILSSSSSSSTSRCECELVGMKKTLVFYRGRAPRVCRVFKKSGAAAAIKKHPPSSNHAYAAEVGSSQAMDPVYRGGFHFSAATGKNYIAPCNITSHADMQELNTAFRGGGIGPAASTGASRGPH